MREAKAFAADIAADAAPLGAEAAAEAAAGAEAGIAAGAAAVGPAVTVEVEAVPFATPSICAHPHTNTVAANANVVGAKEGGLRLEGFEL